MLHDVGGLSEAAKLTPLSVQDYCLNVHAHIGSKLLSRIPWLNHVSNVVYHHHTPWQSCTSMMPSESHMLYLADRVDVMLITFSHSHKDYLLAATKVREEVRKQQTKRFAPTAVDAFLAISQPVTFWLTQEPPWLDRTLGNLSPVMNESISLT